MSQDETPPKIHVDADWKAEAQAEKTRLAKEEAETEATGEGPGGQRGLPEADFKTLVGVLASQAIMGLGAVADPQSGKMVIDLEGSKFSIDLLGVLEEKTKGNLADDEAADMKQVLTELRNRFVQVSQMVLQQSMAQGPEDAAGGGAVSL